MAYHIKTRIALSVAALVFCVLSITSWLAMVYFEKQFENQIFAHMSDLLEANVEEIVEEFEIAGRALENVAHQITPDILENVMEADIFLASQTTTHLIFDNGLYLFDLQGKMVALSPWQEELIGQDFSDREYFKQTLESQRLNISSPFQSRQSHQEPVLMLSLPVYSSTGEMIAILGGSLNLLGENFIAELADETVNTLGNFLLVDDEGMIVVHHDREQILQKADVNIKRYFTSDDLIETNYYSTKKEVGDAKVLRFSENGQVGVFAEIRPSGWTLALIGHKSLILGPIIQARMYIAVVLLALSMLTVIVIRLMTSRLTEPLNVLGSKVRNLADDPQVFSPLPFKEFEELGGLAESIHFLMVRVTEKRKELRDQLLFLQNLIDAIPSPIFYKDANHRYLGCNQAFEKFIGMEKDHLIGKSVFDIAPEELAEVYHRADLELWEQGGEQVYEARVRYADDTNHDVIFYKKVFYDYSGQPSGMIGTFLDITARKASENALQQALVEARISREQVDNILSSVADGLIVTDHMNRVTHVNQTALEMMEIASEKVIGRHFTELFSEESLRRQAEEFLAKADHESCRFDFKLVRPGEQYPRVIQASASALVLSDGGRSGIVTLLRDVSRMRELELIKSEFISTAAHEMRTPMSVIMGYCEILMDSENVGLFDYEQQKEFLSEIYRKGEALSQIVDDLFDISRIEAGLPLPIELSSCRLNGLVAEIVKRYNKKSSNYTIVTNVREQITLVADCNKISQVIDNLISNAVKYSPKGGTILLDAMVVDHHCKIEITDEGIGMTDDQLERVFDKFYRVDSSNTAVGGLGIGMSIVKAIIEGHSGNIDIRSSLGQGTKVIINIPLGPILPPFQTSS